MKNRSCLSEKPLFRNPDGYSFVSTRVNNVSRITSLCFK